MTDFPPTQRVEPAATPSTVLLRLYEMQNAYLREIEQYCEHQRELVQSSDMTGLMRLLSRKNRPVDELRRCTAQIRNVTEGPIDWQPAAPRDTVLAIRQKCDQLGERVLEVEAECESMLVTQRDSTSSSLGDLNRRIAAAGAYQAQNGKDPGSPDTESLNEAISHLNEASSQSSVSVPLATVEGADDRRNVAVHSGHGSNSTQTPNVRGGNLDLHCE